ncbi:MAG: class I SAM-dependent methyltransferase [Geobacteraceae bacterium]|nr:class I SAM-dependent methyltransferase [Geobacteraceae bacterium]NTW79521.1 class I SAM-dependent methyltransferase [Geobacteraceae bacterium]
MSSEVEEIHARYARRSKPDSGQYDPISPAVYMSQQELERNLIWWINLAGLQPVSDRQVLEIGCGAGSNLLQLIKLGFSPENLFGNELIEARVCKARARLPAATQIIHGDASKLDLSTGSFDVVLQVTVFSSILDDSFQKKLADRMWEQTMPGGGILWYDFIFNNPRNPDVKGVPVKRIKELFPKSTIIIRKTTLAPPISRLVTKIHPCLYTFFNMFPFLRTHVFCWIQKPL